MIDKLKEKRLIFTVTSGRSGSGQLAMLLNLIPGVDARHEPKPLMSDAYQKVRHHPEFAREWWIDKKLPAIAQSLTLPIYVETAHLFCKGFQESFVDIATQYNIPFDLIVLIRPMAEVAQSMYELNTIPGKTSKGRYWYITPGEKGCLTKLPGWSELHDYQLCFWYSLEIHARMYQTLTADYPCRKVILQTHDMNHQDRFECFLDTLDIPHDKTFWDRWEKAKNKRVNRKSAQKQYKPLPEEYRLKLETEVRERTIIGGFNCL